MEAVTVAAKLVRAVAVAAVAAVAAAVATEGAGRWHLTCRALVWVE